MMRYNLSEVFDLIKDRRTIYPEFYSDRKVHKEIVEKLLNAAIWAPTHGLTQPWRFTVFMEDSKVGLSDFLVEQYKSFVPESDWVPNKLEKLDRRPKLASAVIAVHMHRQDSERIPEFEEQAAVACAVQNMLLMATAYGLGSFWSTPKFLDTEAARNYFELRPQDKCMGLIYLGYPNTEWPKGQRKPIEYLSTWK